MYFCLHTFLFVSFGPDFVNVNSQQFLDTPIFFGGGGGAKEQILCGLSVAIKQHAKEYLRTILILYYMLQNFNTTNV